MPHLPNSRADRDIAHVLHPYTNLRRHAQEGPLIITEGRGVYVRDEDGRDYLEAMAGLWCTSLGFSEPRLVEAATRAMNELPFSHGFGHRSHPAQIELAERLIAMAPHAAVHRCTDCRVPLSWVLDVQELETAGATVGHDWDAAASAPFTLAPADAARATPPATGLLRCFIGASLNLHA